MSMDCLRQLGGQQRMLEFARYDGYVMIQNMELVLPTFDPHIVTNSEGSMLDRSIINF